MLQTRLGFDVLVIAKFTDLSREEIITVVIPDPEIMYHGITLALIRGEHKFSWFSWRAEFQRVISDPWVHTSPYCTTKLSKPARDQFRSSFA